MFPNGQNQMTPRRPEEIAEEALRTQKIGLVLQGMLMFAALGTFLIAIHTCTKNKKGS